jgi:hypothetical protein
VLLVFKHGFGLISVLFMHAMVLVYSGLQGLVDMAEVHFIQGSNFHTV